MQPSYGTGPFRLTPPRAAPQPSPRGRLPRASPRSTLRHAPQGVAGRRTRGPRAPHRALGLSRLSQESTLELTVGATYDWAFQSMGKPSMISPHVRRTRVLTASREEWNSSSTTSPTRFPAQRPLRAAYAWELTRMRGVEGTRGASRTSPWTPSPSRPTWFPLPPRPPGRRAAPGERAPRDGPPDSGRR